MYIVSRYNLIKEDSLGNVILANTVTTKCIKIDKTKASDIKMVLSAKKIDQGILDRYPFMIENGYVVKSNVDELKSVTDQFEASEISMDTLELTIIVTDDCNFKCKYCYQEHRSCSEIKNEVLDGILNYIEKYGSLYRKIKINWFGGEPLLVKDKIVSFMKKCREICVTINRPLIGFMSTNGYNLSLDTFIELINCNIVFFQVTLDGNRATHNRLRPHKDIPDSSFDVIFSNLKSICSLKRFYRITIRINLTKSAVKSIIEYAQMANFMVGNHKFEINCQKMSDYGGQQIKELANEIINDDDFDYAVKILANSGLNIAKQPLFEFAGGVCSAGRKNSYYISQEGGVFKCALALYDEEYSEENAIGKMMPEGEILLNEIKEAKWVKMSTPDVQCKECVFYPLCLNHYCPYRRLKRNTKICYKYKSLIINSLEKYCVAYNEFKMGGNNNE